MLLVEPIQWINEVVPLQSTTTENPWWVDAATAFQAAVTAVAIIIGGCWAIVRFRIFRETAPNVDFRANNSWAIRTADGYTMFLNVLFANRARTSLQVNKVIYRWHYVSANVTAPKPEAYEAPRSLIEKAQAIEPGKEAWGVARIELTHEAIGALLWVQLETRRVGMGRWIAKLYSLSPWAKYQEPEPTDWTFFVPIAEVATEETLWA